MTTPTRWLAAFVASVLVGHHLWYAGLALLVLAVLRSVPLPHGPVPVLAAVGTGLTHASNALEGGTAALSTVVAVALAVRFRRERLVLLAYGLAVLVIAGWGVWFAVTQGRVFPQPSELRS